MTCLTERTGERRKTMINEEQGQTEKVFCGTDSSAYACYTFFKDMLNCILSFFGLMTIKRARTLTTHLHVYYVRSVQDGVKRDFNITPNPGAVMNSSQWWHSEFNSIIRHHADDVVIANKNPKFAEYV